MALNGRFLSCYNGADAMVKGVFFRPRRSLAFQPATFFTITSWSLLQDANDSCKSLIASEGLLLLHLLPLLLLFLLLLAPLLLRGRIGPPEEPAPPPPVPFPHLPPLGWAFPRTAGLRYGHSFLDGERFRVYGLALALLARALALALNAFGLALIALGWLARSSHR